MASKADLDVRIGTPPRNTYQDLADVVVGQGLNASSHNITERDLVESLKKHKEGEVEQTFGGAFGPQALSDSSELVE